MVREPAHGRIGRGHRPRARRAGQRAVYSAYSAHNEPSKPSSEPSNEPGKPTGALANDLETRFHDLPTYPTGLDFEAMPTGLLRMIRDRKPGLWNLKATEALKTRE